MAGQLIKLTGVIAAAAVGAPRIDMTDADLLATKILSLRHIVSARALSAAGSGGVIGRCRATGKALLAKGTNQSGLSLTTVAGKKGLNANSNAGLALPAGSLTPSYTCVAVVALNSADIASANAINIISGWSAADVYSGIIGRYYGAEASSDYDKLASSGLSTISAYAAKKDRPVGAWCVLISDFNFTNKTVSVAVNDIESVNNFVLSAAGEPQSGAYLELGYHASASSLRSSAVGELFTFSESLLSTSVGRSQLAALVAALKTEYGIS